MKEEEIQDKEGGDLWGDSGETFNWPRRRTIQKGTVKAGELEERLS